jgi:hypothetical protein
MNPARRESGAGFLVSVCDLRLQSGAPHLRRESSTSSAPAGTVAVGVEDMERNSNSICCLLEDRGFGRAIAA